MEQWRLVKRHNCDETWVRGHQYKQKLYILGFEEDEENDEGDSNEPYISLHTIIGVNTSQTMRLRVQIVGVMINTILSTKIPRNISEFLFLSMPNYQVAVMNGERITSPGICEDVTLHHKGISFTTNLFILPLVGIKLVLGIKWLHMFGPIRWQHCRCHFYGMANTYRGWGIP